MLGIDLDVSDYFDRLEAEIKRVDQAAVNQLADLMYDAWQNGRSVFVFGNGGSATTASHLAEDFGKNCVKEDVPRDQLKRLKIMSLTDNTGWITAIGNDLGYDQIFVEQLMQYAVPGDLAIAISGSGNSPNVLAAIEWANANGLTTFGMTGFDGGRLKQMQTAGLHIALDDMAMAESLHMAVCHWVVDDLYARINQIGRHGQ